MSNDAPRVTVTIDGMALSVPAGTNVIDAARLLNVDVPHFCYHPGLSVDGNCRMCLVEVKGARNPVIACNTRCSEGLEVSTNSPLVQQSRASVLEFILVNHPIDCGICDQAGECELQDNYVSHDLQASRNETGKIHKDKAVPLSDRVMLDQERCILCSRCVRFCTEVAKDEELFIASRGNTSFITTFPGETLDNAYSLNTVDICPVGALTSRDFRFQMRSWFLKETDTVCAGCERGCSIIADHNVNENHLYRMRPRHNPDVNNYWMCDPGRLEYKRVAEGRQFDIIAGGAVVGRAEYTDYPDEVELKAPHDAVQSALQAALAKGRTAVVVSTECTNEEMHLAQRLAKALGADAAHAVKLNGDGPSDEILMRADKSPNTEGARRQHLVTHDAPSGHADFLASLGEHKAMTVVVIGGGLAQNTFLAKLRKVAKTVVVATPYAVAEGLADVVLPMACWGEIEGTYTNFQGHVQQVRASVKPAIGVAPGANILQAMLAPLDPHFKPQSIAQLYDAWAHGEPGVGTVRLKLMPSTGVAWA